MPAEPEHLLQPETRLYSPDRSWHCTLNEYAMFVLSQNNITEFVLRNFSTPGDHLFHLSVPIAQEVHVVDKFDISHAVTNIVFRALVHVDDRIPVDLEHRSYKDAQVGHGTITLPGAEGLLTVVEMRGRPYQVTCAFHLPSPPRNLHTADLMLHRLMSDAASPHNCRIPCPPKHAMISSGSRLRRRPTRWGSPSSAA